MPYFPLDIQELNAAQERAASLDPILATRDLPHPRDPFIRREQGCHVPDK